MAKNLEKNLASAVKNNDALHDCIVALSGYKAILDPKPKSFASCRDITEYANDMRTIAKDAHKELQAIRKKIEEDIEKATKKKDYISSDTYCRILAATHQVKIFHETCNQYNTRLIEEHKLAESLDRLLKKI